MKKIPPSKFNLCLHSVRTFFSQEGLALGALTLSLVICFKDWIHFSSHIFLSLDSTVLYYPLTIWVHDHLTQGHLPLISDLLYNGAPVAATSMAGVLSPFIWLFHAFFSGPVLVNLLFLTPFVFYLFGAYFLGRELSLSSSACVLLALLWTYNGHQMAQLDHQNVAWAHAFFPWAFCALLRFQRQKHPFWLLWASFCWGLCLLSGHPQVVFLEGLFFLFWALIYPRFTLRQRLLSFLAMTVGTLFFTAPLTLFTTTYLSGEKWSNLDRFFHSWTPVNFMTFLFPWFFGRSQYDRMGSDYWWQYQFVEMQMALSIVGLFFVLLFFISKRPQRRWVAITALFGLTMALGKFFVVYPLIQSLPLFSFFRDPARYWFLITWVIGLGAAYAWDDYFQNDSLTVKGRILSLGLWASAVFLIMTGWLLLHDGQPLLRWVAAWFIQHCLLGDSLHTQTLSVYLERLPSKWAAISQNLNPARPRVFLPLLFLLGLILVVFNRKNWNLSVQKILLMGLVFTDLMIFRMPLGHSFYSPQDIPNPQIPHALNRSLPLISQTDSPLPPQYGQYAFPNMNLVSHSPVLPFDANPTLYRYNILLARLGWFAWVYKNRDLLGFTHYPHLLSVLGVDQIVSDTPFVLPRRFKTIQNHAPYVYHSPEALPKAYWVHQYQISPWPESIATLESPRFNPHQEALLESNPGFPSSDHFLKTTQPEIQLWNDTHLSLIVQCPCSALLVLQKTFLPGWQATVNGLSVQPLICDLVLTGIPLKAGINQVDLVFSPTSLRLGFFLLFLFLAVLGFSLGSFLLT